MLAEERRKSILNLIREQGSARTADLAKTYNVSDQTIRRDLFELAEQGLISKEHGGGVLINYESVPYPERSRRNHDQKRAIAEVALNLVKTNLKRDMCIGLGPGTTTEELARRLNGLHLNVVTNSLTVARALNRQTTVRLVGGRYRPGSELVVGEWSNDNLESLFIDISFIGVSGIDEEAGYTVTEQDEALVLRQFMRVAKRTVVITDSSKFQRVGKAPVAPLEAAHVLITDALAAQANRESLHNKGVEVLLAKTTEAKV